jgi:hypothetical protein
VIETTNKHENNKTDTQFKQCKCIRVDFILIILYYAIFNVKSHKLKVLRKLAFKEISLLHDCIILPEYKSPQESF